MKKIDYGNYKKPSDFMSFEQGDTQIRIISNGLLGYQHGMNTARGFVNLGICPEDETCEHCKKGYEPKLIWKWIVFDHTDSRVKLLDAGPMIGNQIAEKLGGKHGDPKEYDIVINRKGLKLETEYLCAKAKGDKEIPEKDQESFEFKKKRLINKYFKKRAN